MADDPRTPHQALLKAVVDALKADAAVRALVADRVFAKAPK